MRINIKKRNYEYVTAPVGNIWKHVSEFWKRRHEPHILFLKYEDMKKVKLDLYYLNFQF